jgi:hypothetical protein
MKELILFFLSTTGMTLIVTSSSLFKGVRLWIAKIFVDHSNRHMERQGRKPYISGFLNEVLNCHLCFSPYAGSVCATVLWSVKYYDWMIWVLYPFAGAPIASIIVLIWKKLHK